MKLTICGGGNGAHTLAGIASNCDGVDVSVFDIYRDESDRWTDAMNTHGFCVNFKGQSKLIQPAGKVKFSVTKDVKIVEKSEFVIICVPAYTHELYLKTIVSSLPDNCTVVGLPGQPGFEYQTLFHLQKHKKACSIMSLETLPWACRIVEYGREVMVVGTKDKVQISFMKRNDVDADIAIANVQHMLGNRPILQQLPHVLTLTLATKASIHPPIMYSRWKDWDGLPFDEPPLFYQGVDKAAADTLDVVTEEITAISRAVKSKFPHLDFSPLTSMNGWLIDHYGDQIADKSSLLTSLQTNKAYNGLKHPSYKTDSGEYLPDFQYRYLSEDVPYGLVVLRAIADLAGVQTPTVDKIIVWAQTKLGKEYLVDGKLSTRDADFSRFPKLYGMDSLETIVNTFD